MVACLPCAAAGPPGIAVAAVGTVGYGVYKYAKPKKKIKNTEKEISDYKKTLPLNRFGKPSDIANAVLFFASNKSPFWDEIFAIILYTAQRLSLALG